MTLASCLALVILATAAVSSCLFGVFLLSVADDNGTRIGKVTHALGGVIMIGLAYAFIFLGYVIVGQGSIN